MSPPWNQALLAWYRVHRRDLPWRVNTDPYRVLVSEFMLQQTRVEAVLEHYRRFLERFPTLDNLAQADVTDVLAAWSGLGYYRRARFLHEAVRAVLQRGGWPQGEAELRQLPGLGEYTAAALASISQGRPALALDGNAVRVLSRLTARSEPPDRACKEAWRSQALVGLEAQTAGDFTQALMELGATTCLPRNPRCLTCPLQDVCLARKGGLVASIPAVRPRRVPVPVEWCVGALTRSDGRVLLVRSELQPFLQDSWLPPWGTDPDELARRCPAAAWREAGECRHGVTFRDLRLRVFTGRLDDDAPEAEGVWREQRWVDTLAGLPVSSLTRKVLTRAGWN